MGLLPIRRPLLAAAVLAVVCLVRGGAAHAEETRSEIGDTASALPGVVRVPMAGGNIRLGVGAAASAGYGFTESVLGGSDAHHRVFGSIAASYRAADWLALRTRARCRVGAAR